MNKHLFFLPLLALALFFAGCGSDSSEDARAAADRFTRYIMTEDYGGAYRDASMNFRTRNRFEEFNSQASLLKAVPGTSITWGEPVKQDDAILLTGTVPRESGAPATVDLTLTREIAEWKVSKFEVK